MRTAVARFLRRVAHRLDPHPVRVKLVIDGDRFLREYLR